MSGCIPDWATLPDHVRRMLENHVMSIKEHLSAITCLGVDHPQSESRMTDLLNHAQAFLYLKNRVEGANNSDFYAYECRKEQNND